MLIFLWWVLCFQMPKNNKKRKSASWCKTGGTNVLNETTYTIYIYYLLQWDYFSQLSYWEYCRRRKPVFIAIFAHHNVNSGSTPLYSEVKPPWNTWKKKTNVIKFVLLRNFIKCSVCSQKLCRCFFNFHNLWHCLATHTASPWQLCLYLPITATSIRRRGRCSCCDMPLSHSTALRHTSDFPAGVIQETNFPWAPIRQSQVIVWILCCIQVQNYFSKSQIDEFSVWGSMNSNDTPTQMLTVMLRSLSSSSNYIFNEEGKRGRPVLEFSLLENPFLIQEVWPAKSSRNVHYKKQDFVFTDPPSGMWVQCYSALAHWLWDLCGSSLSCLPSENLFLSKGVKPWAEVMLLTELSPSLNFSTLQLSQTCKTISFAKLLLFGACSPIA